MERLFPKVDSLKLTNINGIVYVIGEDKKQKCDYCSQKSIPHRIVLGKHIGERTIDGKVCLGVLPLEDVFITKRKSKEFEKLGESIRANNLMLCAIRVYTPHGAEALEEIGDYEELSVRTGEALKVHSFFEEISKQQNKKE